MSLDSLLFIKQLFRSPAQISAIVPSSRRLAMLMAAQVDPQNGPVAEFGPGTGIITQALLERGVEPGDLTLLELNPEFCLHLQGKFPQVAIHNKPAQELLALTKRPLGAVVSGLPLLSMSRQMQREILSAAFAALKENGTYIQFTYGTRSPVDAELCRDLDLSYRRSERIWGNLPPAQVYIYRRRLH